MHMGQGRVQARKDKNMRRILVVLVWTLVCPSVFAGRPLATDDAATAERGTCQVEGWYDRTASDSHTLIVAPACGIAEGVELGGDYSVPHPVDATRASAGLALKVAPQRWQAGTVRFGLKLSTANEQPADSDWRSRDSTILLLASYEAAPNWVVHANLGHSRSYSADASASLLNLALVWTPHPHWLTFAEVLTNDRRADFGDTLITAGLRWWLVPERFGLDLTRSSAGTTQTWTAGFGWYGIGL